MAVKCPQCGAEFDVHLYTLDRSIRCDCGANVDLAVGHQQTSEDGMQVVSPEASREGVSADNESQRNGINALGDAVPVEALNTRIPPNVATSTPVRPRPHILCLVVLHFMMGGVGAYLTSFLDIIYSALRVVAFVGLIFSQVSLLGIWGSLGTNHWRTRVIGVVVGNGYLFIVFNIGVNDVSIETLIVLLAVIMVVSLPLLIARICRVVIRLDDSPVTPVGPIQFSIRHLIVVTFVVACLITICKLVQPILSRRPNIDLLAIALTFGIVGVIPLWSALASKWPTVFSVGVVAVGACTGYCLGWVYMEEELYWMTATATEALSVVVTLLLVRSWGYRLVRLPKKSPRGSGLEEITT
jgi:hypothetical protein